STSTSATCMSWIDSATSSKAPADQTADCICLSNVKSVMCGNLLCALCGFHPCERLAGRFLLGVLLRPPLAAPELFPVDDGGAREAAVVRRALGGELRVHDAPAGASEELLEVGLRVDAR